ncbi:MAG TPA: DUF4097 family beta strand repeat-containing protein [Gammaproteobacteria bacterium]|nr:DUF4097 family beta strand repeat-containing protein [Gammaproteobacteria bacterium]
MKRALIIVSYLLLSLVGIGIMASAVMLTANSAYADSPGNGKSINETRTAKINGTVQISNVAGSVTVNGWHRNEIHVGGTLSPDAERLEITPYGDGYSIRVILPEHSHSSNEGADLVVNIPDASRLSVNTVSADIGARGLYGTAQLESVSGNVTLKSTDSDITAKSVSGKVDIGGSSGDAHVYAHSISGDVKVQGVIGDLQAESVSGSVKVITVGLDRAKLNSTSGNVDFSGGMQKNGSYTFNSISGNLTLFFQGTPDARFDISSFSGDIDNNFGPKPQRTNKYAPGIELHFVSGHGSAQVNAHTLSGNISLRTP